MIRKLESAIIGENAKVIINQKHYFTQWICRIHRKKCFHCRSKQFRIKIRMDILIPHRKTTKQMMHQINGLNNPILIMQISLIKYDHNKGCYQPRIGQ